MRRPQLTTLLLVTVVVLGVYGRALRAPFIFDDLPAIVDNPSTERLWPPIGDATHPGPLNPPRLAPTARRPFANLTFAVDRRIAGLDPAWFRGVNLALHALTAVLLAALVRRTLRLPYFAAEPAASAAAALGLATALVWAVHPLVTEAVVYVTQRTEILAALCYLATLLAGLRYWAAPPGAPRVPWVIVAALACLIGIASKEVVVSAPLAVLLYERTFLAGSFRAALRRSWPLYAGLALAWVLLAFLNAGPIGGLSDARHRLPLAVWWMTQAKVLCLYLKLALWPWPLSIHYAPAYLTGVAQAWPWIGGVGVIAAATLWLGWRRPALRFVLLVVVATLAPTLVVPLPKMMAAERRMYLPLAGLVAIAIVGGHRVLARRWPRAAGRPALIAITALVLIASAVSVARLAAYESAVTIWHDAVRHQPADPMAHYNLSVALREAGRAAEAKAELDATLHLDPEYAGALVNVGALLEAEGRSAEAMEYFERALAVEPDDAVAHNDLGAVLTKVGRPADAIPHLLRALERGGPLGRAAQTHLNLGRALVALGRAPEAIGHLEAAAQLAPADGDVRFSLGTALLRAGRPDEAIGHLTAAIERRPDDAEAHDALASALLQIGRGEEALPHYARALALRPDDVETRNNMASALLALGRSAQAIAELERVVGAKPDYANARFNLGAALLAAGRPRDAAPHLDEAVRLDPNDAQARFKCALAYAGSEERAAAIARAEEARALALAAHDDAFAAEIARWLASYRGAAAG